MTDEKRDGPSRAALIAIATALAVAVAWKIASVLLLALAAMLLALLLDVCASLVARVTRLPRGWALLFACLLLAGLLSGAGFLLAPSVSAQLDQLGERLPTAWRQLEDWLRGHGWGRRLVEAAQSSGGALESSELGRAFGLIGTSFGVMLQVVLFLVVALHLAAQPRLYADGALAAVPARARTRARAARDQAAHDLRWWLVGQACGMTLVGALTALGLWAIHVPMALVLGLIAGALNFVPNLGPWIAATPGMLIALTISPTLAGWTALVYLGVQVIESYLVTPLILQRNVRLAPALLILSQLALGILLGPIAVALTAPILVVTNAALKAGRERPAAPALEGEPA